jgi:hypothetical protein
MRPTRIAPAVFVHHDDEARLQPLTVLQAEDNLITGTNFARFLEEVLGLRSPWLFPLGVGR